MANKRMIDIKIVSSLRFLEMSKAAQALYLHIIANADDEGVAEAGTILRITKTRKTALQELIDNNFVALLDQRMNIVYTVNWQSFNHVDARYGQPSYYHRTLEEHFPDIHFVDFTRKNGDLPTGDSRTVEYSRVEYSGVEDSTVQSSGGMQNNNDSDDSGLPLYRMLNRNHPDMFFAETYSDELQGNINEWLSKYGSKYTGYLNAVASKILRMEVWCPDTCASLAEKFMELNYDGINKKWKTNTWIDRLEGFVKAEKTEPDYGNLSFS